MLFSSITFLFYFLPVLLLFWIPIRFRTPASNIVLLIASLIFYAWGEPVFVGVMLFSICANYLFGILISKAKKTSSFWLAAGVSSNLIILIYFKYIGFIIENLRQFLSLNLTSPNVILPLGISFFTFQAITYLVDLKRGEIKVQKNIFNLALYISLFPQLIAGPIVRYHDIESQMTTRSVDWSGFANGVRRFTVGLAKKILIANSFALVADEIFATQAGDLSRILVVIAILSYTFQIYFDFSGYSDMAIGLGQMFGFKFLENFNYPYIAKSIQDFWRRWHMSLSTFFRDYLYIPLGGSRKGSGRTYVNLVIVFFLCGLWHGAAWTFVLWGSYYGFFLVVERLFWGRVLEKFPNILSRIYTLSIVMMGWLLFRAVNAEQFGSMLKIIITGGATNLDHQKYTGDFLLLTLVPIAVVGSGPWFRNKFLQNQNGAIPYIRDLYLLGVFLLSVAFLSAGTYNPFIYFRF